MGEQVVRREDFTIEGAPAEEIEAAVAGLVDAVEEHEPGTLVYAWYRHVDDPRRWTVWEVYPDQEAASQHFATRDVRQASKPLKGRLDHDGGVSTKVEGIAGKGVAGMGLGPRASGLPPGDKVVVRAEFTMADAPAAEVEAVVAGLVAAVEEEETGTLTYAWYRHVEEPNRWTVLEVYADDESQKQHLRGPKVREASKPLGDLIDFAGGTGLGMQAIAGKGVS